MNKLTIMLACSLLAAPASAQFIPQATAIPGSAPEGINYQGRLEEGGFPVNATKSMIFRVYSAPVAGVLLWTSPTQAVPVALGLFSAVVPVPTTVLVGGGARYLEVSIDGTLMSPRELLNSVPYALIAKSVEGNIDVSTAGLAINANSTAVQPALYISSVTGNVGVGTGAPITAFDVGGSAQFGSGTTKSTFSATGALNTAGKITAPDYTATYGLSAATAALSGDLSVAGSIVGGNGTAGSLIFMNGAAGQSRALLGQTAAVNRWIMYLGNPAAEAGADAGSNFQLFAISDAGAGIDSPLVINRAAGGDILVGQTGGRKVGIGTASPCSTCTLHVAGGASVTGAFAAQLSAIGANTGQIVLKKSDGELATDATQLTWDSASDLLSINGLSITSGQIRTAGSDPLNLVTSNGNGNINIATGASEKVAIGTTSASSYGANVRLHVNSAANLDETGIMAMISNSFSETTVGRGGMLSLGGTYNEGAPTAFATIAGFKESATAGNNAGYFVVATPSNGVLPAERMRITSTGNVGIGTTNPGNSAVTGLGFNYSSVLHIHGATRPSPTFSGTGVDFRFVDTDGAANAKAADIVYDDQIFRFRGLSDAGAGLNDPTLLINTNTGVVGIGTASPAIKLDVLGASAAEGDSNGIAQVKVPNGNQLAFGVNSVSSYSWVRAAHPGVQFDTLALQPDGGNVGIGTTAPSSKLHVANGNLLISGTGSSMQLTGPQKGIIGHSGAFDLGIQTNGVDAITIAPSRSVTLSTMAATYVGGSAHLCVTDAGLLFASEAACP